MTTNRNGFADLDRAVATQVRALIHRHPSCTIAGLARTLDMRRATLSVRVNGRIPFSPAQLDQVATLLGTTASAITSAAERALRGGAR